MMMLKTEHVRSC